MRTPHSFALPYAVWMLAMLALPATPVSYAARAAAACAALLVVLLPRLPSLLPGRRDVLWGVAGGLFVLALWVWPEQFPFYRERCILSSWSSTPGGACAPAECGWALSLVRLAGSAFVISVAEELFFRKWLVDFAGFWWSVALFAIEHDRFVAGAAAGIVYGLLATRISLKSAAIAHIVTNLALGAIVLKYGLWQFW